MLGNKLLADFMGYKFNGKLYIIPEFNRPIMGINENAYESNDHYHYEESDEFKLSELNFDCDWNWLMPVICKLKNIIPLLDSNKLKELLWSNDIIDVWEEVVKLILNYCEIHPCISEK